VLLILAVMGLLQALGLVAPEWAVLGLAALALAGRDCRQRLEIRRTRLICCRSLVAAHEVVQRVTRGPAAHLSLTFPLTCAREQAARLPVLTWT